MVPSLTPSNAPTGVNVTTTTTSTTQSPTPVPTPVPTPNPTPNPTLIAVTLNSSSNYNYNYSTTSTSSSSPTRVDFVNTSASLTVSGIHTSSVTDDDIVSTTAMSDIINESRDEDLNNAQQISFVIVVFICTMILLIRLIYTKIPRYQNTDIPYFGYVVKFIFQMLDVLSDIFVAELMYINNDFDFFYLSITFIILPLIIAIFCLFYFKFFEWNLGLKSNNNNKMSQKYTKYAVSQRITNYFDKYWILLLLWCVLSCNFYSAITLAQSKIFCLSMFNLQLKRKEYESLAIVKFINSTICENIAQMIVQILYLQHIKNNHSLLVYISLTFSVYSILSQIVIFLTQLNNILIEYNKHVTQILSFDVKTQLSCKEFKSKHEFTNNLIEKSLINAFNMSDESFKWTDRSDIKVQHEVYFIDGCKLKTNHLMDVYFNTTISCYNDIDSIVRDAVELTINKLATNKHSRVHKQFLQNVRYCFGFASGGGSNLNSRRKRKIKVKIIQSEFEIIDKKLIDKEFENGVLSRLSVWRAAVVDILPNINININLTFYQLPKQPKVNANKLQLGQVTSISGVTSGYGNNTMGGVGYIHDDDDDDEDTDDDMGDHNIASSANGMGIRSDEGNGTQKGTNHGEENVEIQVIEKGIDGLNAESEGLAISVEKESEGDVSTGFVE